MLDNDYHNSNNKEQIMKVILEVKEGSVYTLSGTYIGIAPEGEDFVEGITTRETTLQLVKSGITVDDIVKLKQQDLI